MSIDQGNYQFSLKAMDLHVSMSLIVVLVYIL